MNTQAAITSLAFASLVVGASVIAGNLLDKEINDGSVQMYTQLSHTDNFIFIDAQEEVYTPCMVRDPKGCPVEYPSLGFVARRISADVVQLKEEGVFWCKTSTIPKPIGWKSGDYHPHFWCDESGWVEGGKPKSFSKRSNIAEPHSLILPPAVIDQIKMKESDFYLN